MSAAILTFPAKREPTMHGEAVCVMCGHQWHAVVPPGTARLECPSCHDNMGYLRHPVVREGVHWACGCGCMLFHITPAMTYCVECGKEQQLP